MKYTHSVKYLSCHDSLLTGTGIRAGWIHVGAPSLLIIWRPGQANNLAPLRTDIL